MAECGFVAGRWKNDKSRHQRTGIWNSVSSHEVLNGHRYSPLISTLACESSRLCHPSLYSHQITHYICFHRSTISQFQNGEQVHERKVRPSIR